MGQSSFQSISDEQLKQKIQSMDDYDFEHLIADLWERQGWRTQVKQQSVDRGVDVVAERDDPFPQKWLIQAKCYSSSNTIGGPDVREYVSLQHRQGVDGAIVVSSGRFTKQARQEEEEHNLKLIDGDRLVSMIRETNSYDLLEQYLTATGSSVSQQVSQSTVDSSAARKASTPSGSSNSSHWSRYSKDSEGWTRLHEYLDKVQTGKDIEEGIEGLRRILMESPPRTNWWKAIVAITGYWVLLFLIAGSLSGGILEGIMQLGFFVGWIVMPIALYKDSKMAPEYTAYWTPKRWVYILGALMPIVSFFTGLVYLSRRWWYGNNRELNDAQQLRSDFESMVTELKQRDVEVSERSETEPVKQVSNGSSQAAVSRTASQKSDTGYSMDEYQKHITFIQFIEEKEPSLDMDPVKRYLEQVISGLESGGMSTTQYFPAEQKLQEWIDNSEMMIEELRDTPPSSNFERTEELYEQYLAEVESTNSGLERIMEAVKTNEVTMDMVNKTIADLHSITETSEKLARSIESDFEEINAFVGNPEKR